jgi:hypothetical protein
MQAQKAIARIHQLKGKRLVVADGRVVTAFHATNIVVCFVGVRNVLWSMRYDADNDRCGTDVMRGIILTKTGVTLFAASLLTDCLFLLFMIDL